MNLFVKSIQLIICSVFFAATLQADIVRRAAIDIGSGETKLTIADVDTQTNNIIEIHYQDFKAVELRRDLASSSDGNLSTQIEMRLVAVLNNFKSSTENLSPEQWVGVGTSVFRKAKNGKEFLDRIYTQTGMKIYIASQAEEGEIGFMSAVASSGLEADNVIAWDSGNGSFQMTSMEGDNFQMYGAEFAFVPAMEVLISTLRSQTFYPEIAINPVTNEEVNLLSSIIQNEKLPLVPAWIAETSKKIVSFGSYTSIFSTGKIATGKESYTRAELYEAIQKFTGKTDAQLTIFPEPPKTIVGLTLLYSVMNHCAMDNMTFVSTNGLCEGLLIIPRFWKP